MRPGGAALTRRELGPPGLRLPGRARPADVRAAPGSRLKGPRLPPAGAEAGAMLIAPPQAVAPDGAAPGSPRAGPPARLISARLGRRGLGWR